jgi:Cu/Ag efflux protein CusF
MKTTLLKLITVCAFAAFATTAVVNVRADDKPAASASAKKDRPTPFYGKINSIDKAAKTITIGKTKTRTIAITDKTKVMKDNKAATLDDANVGDEVAGSYRDNGGKLEANSLRIGPKPEGAAKAPRGKKKKE